MNYTPQFSSAGQKKGVWKAKFSVGKWIRHYRVEALARCFYNDEAHSDITGHTSSRVVRVVDF